MTAIPDCLLGSPLSLGSRPQIPSYRFEASDPKSFHCIWQVHDVPISDRDLERECRAQLKKLRASRPDFQYSPELRLSGSKAIFDAQQLEYMRNDEEDPGSRTHTFTIPQITVDPPPPSPNEKKKLEKASEAPGQKKMKTRKKPDTRGKTFHFMPRPTSRTEGRLEPDVVGRKSSFYVDT